MLWLLQTTVEALSETAEDSSWLETLYATLFDPQWNKDNAGTIWPVICGILFLTGIGLPTPEDIWLTLAGFSAYKQAGDTFVWYYYVGAFVATTIPILLGDTCAWWLGKRFGFGIRDRFKIMRSVLNEKRIRKVQGWFDNYGNWTVFLGRQVAGVRFVTFFSAGAMKMSLPRFLLFDFLGCLVSIPIWLTLGGLASVYGREWLETASQTVGGSMLAAGVVALIVLVVVVKIRSRRRAKRDAEVVEEEIRLSARVASTPGQDKPAV